MKKLYTTPALGDLSFEENKDIIRTSGLFDPQNATQQQALDDYLSGYGVKAGIAKYTK